MVPGSWGSSDGDSRPDGAQPCPCSITLSPAGGCDERWLAGTRLDPGRETTSNPPEDQQSICLVLLPRKQEASRGVGLAGGRHIRLGKEPEPLRWRGWGGGGSCDSYSIPVTLTCPQLPFLPHIQGQLHDTPHMHGCLWKDHIPKRNFRIHYLVMYSHTCIHTCTYHIHVQT